MVALALGAGTVGWYAWRRPAARPFNVVFILADTMRADHLSAYGYHRPTSPNIDRFFLERGILFRAARSQASCTYPSVNSILTSRYPAQFLSQPEKRMGIPEGVPSLAEILQKSGYRTVAVSASPIVRKTFTKYNNFGGFDRGFEQFDESCYWKDARCVNEIFAAQLAGLGEPFFAYLHYMDAHDPYKPPPWYAPQFAQGYDGLDFIKVGNPNPIADAIRTQRQVPEYQQSDLEHLVDLYDDEIRYFDGEFGVLVADLDNRGLLDRTIVVLVADHGEQFLEHGYMKHCFTLFDTDILTPLAWYIPGVTASEVAAPVEHVDILPTLLDYLGIDSSAFGFEGHSARALIEGGGATTRYAFAMQGERRSVTDARYKLRFNGLKKEFYLHDLSADPEEHFDVLADNAADFVRLQSALREWEVKIAPGKSAQELTRLGVEVQERLRALGYLQ